jgi:hypothetical protein
VLCSSKAVEDRVALGIIPVELGDEDDGSHASILAFMAADRSRSGQGPREVDGQMGRQYRDFLAALKERAARRRGQAREGREPPPVPPYTDAHPPPPPTQGARGY